MPPIRKLLIANRGEIAMRILRTAREMGIPTVAVYSDVDRLALHVRHADEALPIGPAPASESYLSVERILDAARRSGADAIHPGYGFLAENAAFAKAVRERGLLFVGPSPEAIELMGDKLASRRAMAQAGLPVIPGTEEAIEDEGELGARAEEVGYPLMLKAAAGGGGKGIRIVRAPSELASAAAVARSEAQKAFGDPRIYLERFLERPRHVEIQVLGDEHGHLVHLGERECSIQRRHQKLIEESPSPLLDEAMRQRMGEAALRGARAIGYTSAGTMEFLVDRARTFYFLEANTRLQVEHPVTEMVTGLDLVREQLLIAGGAPLSFGQRDVRFTGHAIEVRINAEDPDRQFLPATGRIESLATPSGPGIRFDGGIDRGMEVGLHYDPMLAKLIAWAPDREQAIRRMERALSELVILGVRTGAPAASAVLRSEAFRRGAYDTSFLEENLSTLMRPEKEQIETLAAIVACLHHEDSMAGHVERRALRDRPSPWKIAARLAILSRGR